MTGHDFLRVVTADVHVTVTAPVQKRCPVVDEPDAGTVTITYRTHGHAYELHDLAAYLSSFADRRLSHEDFTAEVAAHLAGAAVSSTWTTAGMEVHCDNAPLTAEALEEALVLLADAVPDPGGAIDAKQWDRRMDRLAVMLAPDAMRDFNDSRANRVTPAEPNPVSGWQMDSDYADYCAGAGHYRAGQADAVLREPVDRLDT